MPTTYSDWQNKIVQTDAEVTISTIVSKLRLQIISVLYVCFWESSICLFAMRFF